MISKLAAAAAGDSPVFRFCCLFFRSFQLELLVINIKNTSINSVLVLEFKIDLMVDFWSFLRRGRVLVHTAVQQYSSSSIINNT